MAFFGSKSYERELKRTYSTDRVRRERENATSAIRTRSISHGEAHERTQRTALASRVRTRAEPTVDEFGVVPGAKGGDKEDPSSSSSTTFSTTAKSASLPPGSASPIISASLSVPRHSNGSGPSSSTSSLHKQLSPRTRTVSGSGSKHSSHSSNPPRRRTPQPDGDGASSSDVVMSNRSTRSSSSKREEVGARVHSSSELKPEHAAPKSRSKTSLRAQAAADSASTRDRTPVELLDHTSSRLPRNVRPSENSDSQTDSMRPSPSPTNGIGTSTQNYKHSPAASQSVSSNSSSPLSASSKPNMQARQRPSPSPTFGPVSSSASNRGDASLAVSSNLNSNPNPVTKKPTCGSASDSSYGSPLVSEFGATFNVKRLLSKPAASGTGTTGVRSEPDTSADSYDSYGAYALATRRRRVEGRSNITKPPSSVYSVTEGSVSLRDHPRKPTSSDPEPPGSGMGSLGRARGLAWGHVLKSDREKEREPERGRGHARESSSYSLSSPSEGAAGYPYGRAIEQEHERRATKASRPLIQLTTSAVRRLSAFGVLQADRDRSNSPITPMTFAPAPSGGATRLSSTPSPLSAGGAHLRRSPNQSSPSPTSASAVMPRTESPRPPVGLTPAEIVAHQYKEQERRRAELEREAARETEIPEKVHSLVNLNDHEHEKAQRTIRVKDKEQGKALSRSQSANAATTITKLDSPSSNKGNISPLGEPPTPYYTVFGDTTGRTVAIGSARDSAFGLFDRVHERAATVTEKAVVSELSLKASTGGSSGGAASEVAVTGLNGEENKQGPSLLRRKLSRKMSGRLKRDGSLARGGGGGRDSGKESSDGRDWKEDFGELLSGGGEDWFSTEGYLRSRPSLTLNTSSSPPASRRSATLPRERNAAQHQPVKMSMDSFVAVQSIESSSGKALPSTANGVAPASRGREDWRSRPRDDKEKDKNKLWGLMKRISSTTLKDKYKRSSAEVIPPVPALPRDFSSPTSPDKGSEKLRDRDLERVKSGNDDTYASAKKLSTHRSYAQLRRPSTAPALNLGETSSEGRFTTLRKKPSLGQVLAQAQTPGTSPTLGTGPSATTAYSPTFTALDNASYNNKSDDSPTTSYGDPTLVNGKLEPVLGQHILPPEALYLFDDFNVDFEKKDDDTRSKQDIRDARSTIVDAYDGLFYREEPASHQALPVPPRRAPQTKTDDGDDIRSESPTIPSFSADNAINTFGYRKRAGTNTGASVSSAFTGADFGPSDGPPVSRSTSTSTSSLSPTSAVNNKASEPPPRPPRSSRRGPPGPPSIVNSSNSSHSSNSPPSSVARTFFEDRSGRASIGALSQASTARPSMLRAAPSSPCSTPSPPPELLDSQSPVSASDSASSTMTFRDINGVATKPVWTEKEKIDKWNDLLDRSDRAGGTLHIGVGGLLSEQVRESAYEPVRDSIYDDY
ncbi:uncharacterized protein FOMMEDRAFT_164511 [Fomitiporia mediterranea MF3/22]|uniref:uncharacterized protein n=1 Tax=Fomitiporia mediterranea (strain MF3/22) TaxID=694068 RepID=UPI0004408050|nr:uncharacterized protein FOMMEDRAFT_164511 [Fomitiporia mediterranea MF3/22]EJD07575.1 hypothetical protein FOMMEDRAFT_164511 [Fomitiporia mediterranea MF3/22]